MKGVFTLFWTSREVKCRSFLRFGHISIERSSTDSRITQTILVHFGLLMFERVTRHFIISMYSCLFIGLVVWHMPVGADPAKTATNDGSERPYGHFTPMILDTVKANDDQRRKITAIVEELRPTIEPLRKKFKEKQTVFLSGMASGASAEDLLCAQRELGQIRGEINDQYLLMRLRVRKLLQPAQQELYDDFLAKQGWMKKNKK